MREEDFEVLRGPLLSGRQSPASLAVALLLAIFFGSLMFFLVHIVLAYDSYYPYQDIIFRIHLVYSIAIMIICIPFIIPKIFMKFQKTQYLLSILVSQNLFGSTIYLYFLFCFGRIIHSKKSLLILTGVSIVLAIAVFLFTCIRFQRMLKSGAYRKGSRKDEQRNYFEGLPVKGVAISGGVGIALIVQFFIVKSQGDAIFSAIGILALLIFLTMVFVLPEQLVILYCKFRFSSFNYDWRGELYPIGFDEKYGNKRKGSKA